MTIKSLMPLDQAFHTRSYSIYKAMQQRFREKRDRRGTLRQVGRELPFSLGEFRDWLRVWFGGDVQACIRCAYCPAAIDAMTFRVDHDRPIKRGGRLDLDNLNLCCDTCNREKGELTAGEYLELVKSLDRLLKQGHLGPAGYKDLRKRLIQQTDVS